MTPLGEWTPDLPNVLGPKLIDAKNVIPHPGGYKPFKEPDPHTWQGYRR